MQSALPETLSESILCQAWDVADCPAKEVALQGSGISQNWCFVHR